jgi:hypothetical protein
MKAAELTIRACPAHKSLMRRGAGRGLRALAWPAALLGASLAGGCITVKAPEEPIVIELNINITQEVIYRLADDVRDNIDENPEIF